MHKTHHPIQQIDLAPSAQYDPGWGPMVFNKEGIGRFQPFGIRRICSFRVRCEKSNFLQLKFNKFKKNCRLIIRICNFIFCLLRCTMMVGWTQLAMPIKFMLAQCAPNQLAPFTCKATTHGWHQSSIRIIWTRTVILWNFGEQFGFRENYSHKRHLTNSGERSWHQAVIAFMIHRFLNL
jgi:hypothetical protein